MRSPDTIAEAFQDLNFHDDTFDGVSVVPPRVPGDSTGSTVEVTLLRNRGKTGCKIRFVGCTNLRIALDFDVLAGNLEPNTSGVEAHSEVGRLREFIQSQQSDWGVAYGPQANSPLVEKLGETTALVFFRVQLFGGVIEVVARNYETIGLSRSPSLPVD